MVRKTSSFSDQNNLYPENVNFTRQNQGGYKPLIANPNQPANSGNESGTQDYNQEDYYRPLSDQSQTSDYDSDSYQNPSQFDIRVDPQQTQQTFNKDIRAKPKNNQTTDLLGFLAHRWWLVLLVALAVAVVGLGLWQIFKPGGLRPGPFPNVEATIIAPEESPSGTPNIWKVEIMNNENVDLLNVELNLEFDSQFRYNRAITPPPSDPKGDKYFFDRIDAANKTGGTSAVIVEFEGIITGRIDEQTIMSGTLKYTPEPLTDFPDNREQVELNQVVTSIGKSLVTGVISPDTSEVEANTETRIRVNFENLSDREISDLRLELTYPDREVFEYISSELMLSNSSSPRTNPSDGNNVWLIDTLPESGQQELIIVGKMKGVVNTEHTFSLDIQIRRADDTYQNIFSTSKDIKIISRPLVINTFIAGKREGRVFRPGENLTFQIDYKNQGSSILNNVELVASINDPADVLDFSTLRYKNNIIGTESNETITWGGQSAPFLNSMSPGLEGNIQFTIQVKQTENMINPSLSQGSYTLIPKVEAKADNIQPVIGQGDIYRASGELNFSEEVNFEEHPSDPNKRIYTITWKIDTAQNQYKDLTIATVTSLPNSAWQSDSIQPSSLANKLKYNPANGQISLNLDEVESLLGVSKPSLTIQFDLEVSKQAGGFNQIELHKEVTLKATDDFTGQSVQKTIASERTKE